MRQRSLTISPMTASTALVLDANQRSALAATRSLGRHGIRVVVADNDEKTLSGGSRYCEHAARYPDPSIDAHGALQAIHGLIAEHCIDVIFPMTDVSTDLVLGHKDQLGNVLTAMPTYAVYQKASDKHAIAKIAADLGIPVPSFTYVAREPINAVRDREYVYPLMVKPRRSRIPIENGYLHTEVAVAKSRDDLQQILKEDPRILNDGVLLQEFVEGTGAGVFALYDRGKEIAMFAHRRIREKPPSGGVSVLSESVMLDPDLCGLSRQLLERLSWHGPAMVEYRIGKDGTPYLMEINARFWGSLQLSASAGVDFPYLAWSIASGREVEPVEKYSLGVKNRWLLGDLDTLYLTWKQADKSFSRKLRATLAFLNFFDRQTHLEVLRIGDLGPFRRELAAYVKHLF